MRIEPSCYSVIIAGGRGTRFWPLSRARLPKQLLKIFGSKTLIGETAARVLPLSGRGHTLVVTVADQVALLRKELRALPGTNFIAEPVGRNTAPCIGLAALEIARRDPAAVMVVLPADHWIRDTAGFRRTLRSAVRLARDRDQLVTIGIKPAYPETGYGYILKRTRLDGPRAASAFSVSSFKEKPSRAVAAKLIRRGALWNSGIFAWKAATLLELLNRHQPAIRQRLDAIDRAAAGKSLGNAAAALRSRIAREYATMPNISIDHAVLEKAASEARVVTLEANFGWSDIGSWTAVHRMLHQDGSGNAGKGSWLAFGAKNCLIHSGDRLVVVLGIDNAFVIDTADALLVGDLTRSQDVRELVEVLHKAGHGSLT